MPVHGKNGLKKVGKTIKYVVWPKYFEIPWKNLTSSSSMTEILYAQQPNFGSSLARARSTYELVCATQPNLFQWNITTYLNHKFYEYNKNLSK